MRRCAGKACSGRAPAAATSSACAAPAMRYRRARRQDGARQGIEGPRPTIATCSASRSRAAPSRSISRRAAAIRSASTIRPATTPYEYLSFGVREPRAFARCRRRRCRSADAVIVIVGSSSTTEGEGYDRATLDLPGEQNRLIEAVIAANPRTVVVINAGAAMTMPWQRVPMRSSSCGCRAKAGRRRSRRSCSARSIPRASCRYPSRRAPRTMRST
jgi:hypothetical protein